MLPKVESPGEVLWVKDKLGETVRIIALIARMADNAANIARRALSLGEFRAEQMRTIAAMGSGARKASHSGM